MSLTIVIVARNAEATIERAVASCLEERDCPLLLIDDRSSDATVDRARSIAGRRLKVLATSNTAGVGAARQLALDSIGTEYAAWLDADDEWIPGRAARLSALLRRGADVAVEPLDLCDGPTGAWLRRLTVPEFLRRPGGAVRLFERNFLPGDTQIAFRTATFSRAGGYDAALNGPESYDILLRAIAQGATIGWGGTVGYRMYAYPTSLSRNLPRQRAALAASLRKHDLETVRALYLQNGYDERVAAWAAVVIAQFRGEWQAALDWLERASPADADATDVLEPMGPWPVTEGWRRAFHRGTILLELGDRDEEATAELWRAEMLAPTAESANNLGVALGRIGERLKSMQAFARALSRYPGYLDAQLNLTGHSCHVTSHPLRREPSRSEYSKAS